LVPDILGWEEGKNIFKKSLKNFLMEEGKKNFTQGRGSILLIPPPLHTYPTGKTYLTSEYMTLG